MMTPTIEEYLEIIYMMSAEGQTVKGARLAQSLHVSRPTVTATLRRLVVLPQGSSRSDWTDAAHGAQRLIVRRAVGYCAGGRRVASLPARAPSDDSAHP